MNRIVGLETEYGCLTNDPSGPPSAVGRVRNWIFEKNRFGLADMHQRDWDEPAGNGGFLFNGGGGDGRYGQFWECTPPNFFVVFFFLYAPAGRPNFIPGRNEM